MPGYDGSIRIDSKINSKGFNKGISGMTAGLGKLAAAVGIAFGVGAIINFGRTAVAAASELASAMTGLKSILDGQGRSFSEAQKFIQEYTADGLVPATNAIIAYKNLALRGYDSSQIEAVMNALKDSAAFARTSSYTMGEAIAMASEGLKNENSILVDNAGVTRNVSMMWQDYARSIGTTVAALTQQQKIQAEVNGILNETRFQTGDAARLSGGYAGMVAALGTSFYNLKVAVGNAIIPILSQIIPYIKAVVDWFVVLFNTIARVISLLFGVDTSMASMEATSADVATNTEAAAAGAGDLASGTEEAEEAAKGALASFDEINVLQMDEPTDTSGGGAATTPVLPSIGGLTDGEPIDLIPDEWTDDIAAFKAQLMDLLGPAIEAFGRLKEALLPLGQTIWEGLQWAWDNILVPFGTWVITEALPAFLDLLAAAATVLNSALIALRPLGLWFWENFLQPIAEWAGDVIIAGLEWLTEALYGLSDWIGENQMLVENIAIIFGSLAAAILIVAAAAVILNVAIAAFGAIMAIITSPITWVVVIIAALIALIVMLVRNWDLVKATAIIVWAKIKEAWGVAAEWFKKEVVDPVKEWFDTALEDIKGFFVSAWNGIAAVWGVAAVWFITNIIDPIRQGWDEFTEGLRTAWENVWNGISDIVKNVINTIIGFINGLISGVVGGVNSIIRALNSIQITIPDWVPGFGGETWGINLSTISAPQIPQLATGAVIPPNAEFLALLGDQRSGRNIEAPEALIRQIIQEETSGMQTDVHVSFEGTLGALVRELQPHIARETRRVGRSLVSGGVA
jgi:hypothetical protein